MEPTDKNPFENASIISQYTSDQAADDGLLVQTSTLLPEHNGYAPHVVSHITTNLLVEQGYFTQSESPDHFNEPQADYKRADIITLLNTAGASIKKALGEKPEEWLVTKITVENPNAKKFEAWAQQNETGRWTLLLPEDY